MTEQTTLYDRLGGEAGVRALVERFYTEMDSLAEVAAIRRMHPTDLARSTDKLFMFLSGWLGGPPLYEQAFGHPFLRRRHLPFAIGEAERDQWLLCMQRALAARGIEAGLGEQLLEALFKVADFMRNEPVEDGDPLVQLRQS